MCDLLAFKYQTWGKKMFCGIGLERGLRDFESS